MTELSFFTTGDGARTAYRWDGKAGNPVLILSNSIGTTLDMWAPQIEALSKRFHVLRYDLRGHGGSSAPPGAYSLDRLGRDVLELMDGLGIEKAHYLGLSLGGFIGQWLGVRAPERIDRLVLSNTSSFLGPAEQFDQRIASVQQAQDMAETAEMFLGNWFPSTMLEANGPDVQIFRTMLLAMDRQGLAGAYAAVRDADLRQVIALISVPTLVIAGQYDTVTALSHSEQIAATVPGAKLVVLPAVHLANIEFPDRFLDEVMQFLSSH